MIKIEDIVYRVPKHIRRTIHKKSIEVVGLDTETLTTGKCFMLCTSRGEVLTPNMIPYEFFTRHMQNTKFVVYNLKFDEGSILQCLPMTNLQELRETNKTKWETFRFEIIPRKMLKIVRGKNAITIYDIMGFFNTSLEFAASQFLNEHKLNIGEKTFTADRIQEDWNKIAEYCIQDAILVKRLADALIDRFEKFDVYPQHLYSTAYISFKYFSSKCNIPLIKNIYDNHPKCLEYAMRSYTGGKFEVTEKGKDYYYEYDIVSAYPFEIANLIDIERSHVIHNRSYINGAAYGFIYCSINIPYNIYSTIAVKSNNINIFPVGSFNTYITKQEYDYLISQGCKIEILDAYWLTVNNTDYPFRKEINRLVKKKSEYKAEGALLDYNIVKIFMNSLYGKFVQLIKKGEKYHASYNWNIIYGSVITANCRIRISRAQQTFPSVVAVHTDSIISTEDLRIPLSTKLGDLSFERKGKGVILGTGIYQIGDKTKFRGFNTQLKLMDVLRTVKDELEIEKLRPYTWREIAFHGWDKDDINKFVKVTKKVNLNFDRKRIWHDDWKSFNEVLERKVYSSPMIYFNFLERKK